MKAGLTVLKFLIGILVIYAIGVGNAQESGDMSLIAFLGLEALFSALIAVCTRVVVKYSREEGDF